MKKFLPNPYLRFALALFVLVILFMPALSFAQNNEPPIVPACGGRNADGSLQRQCGYYDFIQLLNNIVKWIVWISIPISAGIFAWAGFNYMISGAWDKKAQAKRLMGNTFWGFVFILSAWIIVSTITSTLLDTKKYPLGDIIDITK